jgi:hypothetical protein
MTWYENAPVGPEPDSSDAPIDVKRLWAGGIASAVVAALVALVGMLVVRTAASIALYAPPEAGPLGDGSTLLLFLVAAAAALVATALAHLLLLGTPSPLTYFGWIVGLLTVAAAVAPFLSEESTGTALAVCVLHLVIGTVIGSLVAKAAAAASKRARTGLTWEMG